MSLFHGPLFESGHVEVGPKELLTTAGRTDHMNESFNSGGCISDRYQIRIL